MILNNKLHLIIALDQIIKYNNVFNIDFNNVQILTIVRNPYDRIISDLFWYKLIKNTTSPDETFDIINKYLLSSNYDNHNIPQYSFITDDNKNIINNIHILKTETLIDDMHKLGYLDFNLKVNCNKDKVNSYDYLNDQSIKIINDFYHFDFILFNYDKLGLV